MKRKIAVITGTVRIVKVYYDPDWAEYTCVPQDKTGAMREACTNYTDDKQDALKTARAMADEAPN